MKELTRAEEDIMRLLWELEEATVAAVIDELPEPKPAYNTVSTIIRILEGKGFVGHRQQGRGYVYFPLIPKADYSNQSINKLVNGYFKGSFKSMVSFFVKENDISLQELESIMKEVKKDK